MKTLLDFGNEIIDIRDAVNQLEVRGRKNAAIVVFIHDKCNELVEVINEIVNQNGIKKGSEDNGEQNSDAS